jgi:hypothetical protein
VKQVQHDGNFIMALVRTKQSSQAVLTKKAASITEAAFIIYIEFLLITVG